MMKIKWYYFTIVSLLLLLVVITGFSKYKTIDNQQSHIEYSNYISEHTPSIAIVFDEEQAQQNDFEVPFTGKSFIAFKQALAHKESQGKYDIVNDFGYAGKYQFGGAALRAVGIKNRAEFINNPLLQEQAFKALVAINKHELQKEIQKYEGKVINGVEITESGILASAHLLGAGSVKRYLRSNGKVSITDGYGTTLRSYMKKFGGYDTSVIKPNRNAKANDYLIKNSVL